MASIYKRKKESIYWWAYWRDANGVPHNKSTKVVILPKGKYNTSTRNRLMSDSGKIAQKKADEWEDADKGNSDLGQSQKVLAEIADRRFPGHNLKDTPSTKVFLVDYLEGLIDAGKIGGSTAKVYGGGFGS